MPAQPGNQGGGGNPPPDPYDTATIAVTAQMIKELKERNTRREEKRQEATEPADISDDEDENELTNRMDSLRRTHQQNAGPGTVKAPAQEVESPFKFEDAVALTNGGYNSLDNSFPDDLFVLVRNGISPPLTMFTTAALTSIRLARDVAYRKFARGTSSTNIRVLDTSAFPDEKEMTLAHWLAAYENFLSFISEVCKKGGDRIFEGFVKHHQRAVTDPDIDANFEAHKEFDCDNIRAQFFTRPGGFIINVDDKQYVEGWNRVLQRVTRRTISKEIKASVFSQSLQPNFIEGSSKQAKTKNSIRYQPYENKARNSFRKDTDRQVFDFLCVRCGAKGHKADGCKESVPSKPGHSFLVTWRGNYLHRVSDDQPTMPSTYVPYVPSQVTEHRHALETEGKRVVTPYHADAWQQTLKKCGLQETYPNLVHDILYGAPIGFPPPLMQNFIPRNSSSAMENEAVIDQYLQEEIAAGRMYGGLSIEDAEIFFGGHFRTAPLAVIDEGSKFHVVHNLSAKDGNGDSTNLWLNAKDNPTKWYTASMFADAQKLLQAPRRLDWTGLKLIAVLQSSQVISVTLRHTGTDLFGPTIVPLLV
ncbi:uncharacterized protein ARMOST_20218 [Armillaria ostoyae]|uniref:CCHC-type domain-containing protein n=1 Tax=Armillaria ostoyae TaxID=47428 RepID=A0A284S6R0_ARMOS|nr:uncharacterized protein ARMOST_20218 [Armillaria ostoyae]